MGKDLMPSWALTLELDHRPATLHRNMAVAHPSLARGQVWCRKCGHTEKVDSAACLRSGWPRHCGETMTIDAPDERKS